MMSRTLAVPTLLAASVAVPYVATNAPQWSQQMRGGGAAAANAPGLTSPSLLLSGKPLEALTASPQGPGASLYPTQTPLEGVATHSLADVLRLNVSKEWVYQRWARKSTALSELDLFGVRVPLVTGTELHDLAGSLTYFFGVDGRVQRISFRGRTGDTTQLATLLAQRYGFLAQHTAVAGEQLLQVRRGDEVLSELRTRPAPVLWASSPHDSFTVELELQDPATARPIKAQMLPLPTPAAANPPPNPQQAAKAAGDEPSAAANESLGWKTFFPRSRVPKPQIENLGKSDLYQ